MILFWDSHFIVLNKPAGLPMLPVRPGASMDGTLAANLVSHFPDQNRMGPDCGFLYRLDNDTSGIVVAARDITLYQNLREAWLGPWVSKTYRARLLGRLDAAVKVNEGLAHHPTDKSRMVTSHQPHRGKVQDALSFFEPLTCFQDEMGLWFTEVSVKIGSGVRHQIRVHASFLGHPVAGDTIYQSRHQKRPSKNTGISRERMYLHCSAISLSRPLWPTLLEWKLDAPWDVKGT
jgi:23S rRNA pseudouridine1911/1915/1917 synthase